LNNASLEGYCELALPHWSSPRIRKFFKIAISFYDHKNSQSCRVHTSAICGTFFAEKIHEGDSSFV